MNIFSKSESAIPVRMIHFDLKGTPPTFSRLLEWLDLIKLSRYNCALVEWEDTFPWTVEKSFRGKTCYTLEQIKEFTQRARELDIQIIPLMQSIGHLEMVLGLDKFAYLRELPERIDCLNPLASGSKELINTMLDEMLSAFPDIKYFHIGGDEVWCLGKNPNSKAFLEKHSKAELYRHFMEPLLDKISAKGIRPIIWHDMLSTWNVKDIREFSKKTDLMIWGYRDTPDTSSYHFRREIINKFAEAGAAMWGAGQFKGRFEPPSFYSTDPEIEDRQVNTQGWIDAFYKYNMKGICLTAWARNSAATHQNIPIEVNLDYMIYLGAMLWNSRKPDTMLENTVALLNKYNLEQFKNVLKTFNDFRNEIELYWLKSRYLRYIIAYGDESPKPRGSVACEVFETLKSLAGKVEEKGRTFAQSLYTTMDKKWADELVNTRIVAIEGDMENIKKAL